jgi:uncharacterized damage-inducible protein DinB
MSHPIPPTQPAGPAPAASSSYTEADITEAIGKIEMLPVHLKAVLEKVPLEMQATKYVKWTIRQIVNHLADSHVQAFSRFKLALTEENPTIKPYKQWEWSQLADGDSDALIGLQIITGTHARGAILLKAMKHEDFARKFTHPEMNRVFTLAEAVKLYAWHGLHHTAQIQWLVDHYQWKV